MKSDDENDDDESHDNEDQNSEASQESKASEENEVINIDYLPLKRKSHIFKLE